jgi:tetratricopeptide (TPR) repeat protein
MRQKMDSSSTNKQKLYEDLLLRLEHNENNSEILWRMSRVCVHLSEQALKEEYQKNMVTGALKYADKACLADPNNFHCHKWYCASVRKMSAFVGTKERIQFGHQFKEHADIAMKLNSNDWYMCSMYERSCHEVASLSWFERKLATTLFGTPPTATHEEALNYLKKSHELKSNSLETHLWIAECLIALKKKSEAKTWIENGFKLSVTNVSDSIAHKEFVSLKNRSGIE